MAVLILSHEKLVVLHCLLQCSKLRKAGRHDDAELRGDTKAGSGGCLREFVQGFGVWYCILVIMQGSDQSLSHVVVHCACMGEIHSEIMCRHQRLAHAIMCSV